MIVNCPTCAKRHALPDHLRPGTVTITCQSCGHRWQQRETIEHADVPSRTLPRVIEHVHDEVSPEAESRRLAQMARETRDAYLAEQSNRKANRRRWQAYAVFLLAPFVALAMFPDQVVKAAPVTLKAYQRLGYDINVYGLDIRRIERQHAIINGTRVLSVRGEILNLSEDTRRIPWLRFALVDGATVNCTSGPSTRRRAPCGPVRPTPLPPVWPRRRKARKTSRFALRRPRKSAQRRPYNSEFENRPVRRSNIQVFP